MKIVILDGYTTNPGDLTWDVVSAFADEFEVFDFTPQDKVEERCKGAEIVISNKTLFPREILEKLTDTKYIALLSTGYNVVDTAAARELGKIVTNIPAYSTEAVTQHTFALLLELMNHIAEHSDAVHNGEWSDPSRFCFWKTPLAELNGKTMGVVGFGRIGQKVCAAAQAFGMNTVFCAAHKKETTLARQVEMDELLRTSDIISLHCPLTPETKLLINDENIAKMKQGAIVINTARGGMVNDKDLADALNSGRLSGAGLDVLTTEPPAVDNPLLTAKNCIITPHVAWAALETRKRLLKTLIGNINAYKSGSPINVVS